MENHNDSNSEKTHHTIETYALFKNVDRSILSTNSFLQQYGYKFITVDLQELEKKFSSLLSLPIDYKSDLNVLIENSDLSITNEFYNALIDNQFFGLKTLMNKEVIFLKAINDFEQEVINNTVNPSIAIHIGGKLQIFIKALIQQFRLFKNGDIECSMQFQIRKEDRQVTTKLFGPIEKLYGVTDYILTENDINILSKNFKDVFTHNNLTDIAISNFNLSYRISDIKTKFITLMICLESIFNQGKDQISHTVSRHLSLIISQNESEFQNNYAKIKKLYTIRSHIVHNGHTKENLIKATDELHNLVRKAINYCLILELNKKQLFDKLNGCGYNNS